MTVNKNASLFLSTGVAVDFVKTTSKGNYQVRVPASDPIGAADPLRIFRPDGTHYKDALGGVTLTNTAPAAGTVSTSTRGDIDVTKPLVLSDGTPVQFVKWTAKRRIQVKLPDGHPFAVGQENGRIFFRESGRHFKARTDLVLSNAVDSTVAPTADAPASTSNFGIVNAGGAMLGDGYPTFDDAARAAVTMLADGNTTLDIVEITTAKVGSVGVSITRA